MESQKNFGHAYTMALTSATDTVVESELSQNPNVFTYDGLDLKYAITRSLYFSYANSNRLFGIFTRWKTGTLEKTPEVKDDVERKLIAYMCNMDQNHIKISPEHISTKIKNSIKPLFRFILSFCGIAALTSYIRKNINTSYDQEKTYEIVLYVINERLVRFMMPIFHALPVSCAYITHDTKTANYLEKEKIPFIKISHFGYWITRWSQKESWIKRFLLAEKYDLIRDTIERIHPKSIVLVEGNIPSYEVVNQVCKKFAIQSISIQQGWAFFIHAGFHHMSYSKMLVWGDGFSRELQLYNPDQHFIATGSYVVETKPLKYIEKLTTLSFFFQGRTFLINETDWQEFITLTEQVAIQCPDLVILGREHPLFPLNESERSRLEKVGVIFMSPPTYSLDDVFEKSDLTVTIFSSTITESIAAGIVPIVFNHDILPKFDPDIRALGVSIETKSIGETIQVIKKLIENPGELEKFREPMDVFRKNFFAYDKETALQNIVREIIEK